MVDVSLTSVYLAARALVPSMGANGGGSVVTFSSGRARGYPRGGHYAAAKAGVEALTRSLDVGAGSTGDPGELRGSGPGAHADARQPERASTRRERSAATPLGRIGEPADMVGPVLLPAGTGERLSSRGRC